MAVTVKRLEGKEIPCEAQRFDATGKASEVFRITDEHGRNEYCYKDVEAARRVVELSDRERAQHRGRY